MRMVDAALFQYRRPPAKPLPGKLSGVGFREGLIVRITDRENHAGWGEIAPLPGFSDESIDEVRNSAVQLLASLGNIDLPEPDALLKGGAMSLTSSQLPASVAFGIESAILNLRAICGNKELRHQINPQSPNTIPVNGLLSGDESEILESANVLLERGYRTLKLKVGQDSIDEDISRVRALRELVPTCAIRLDANRSWDLETSVRFGKAVRDCEIEYVEEPLEDSSLLGEFHRQTGLAYALDESLRSITSDQLCEFDGVRAVVLKPTLLGGISVALGFADRAKESGVVPVISSAFESSLGLLTLANLAAAIAPEIACGLDTASWLAEDLLARPMVTTNGQLDLSDFDSAAVSIRAELLTEIPVPR